MRKQSYRTVIRVVDQRRAWAQYGTNTLVEVFGDLKHNDLDEATWLPGWTRRHLIAHVAANGDALGNLVHWAATGEPTPMYASPEARTAGIERGLALSDAELCVWLHRSISDLEAAMSALDTAAWEREVVTAQGRAVLAAEIPWLRSREMCVHAVDLSSGNSSGITFADLPTAFLEALAAEISAKRGLAESMPAGPLPEVVAWLAGRPHSLYRAPTLGPWI